MIKTVQVRKAKDVRADECNYTQLYKLSYQPNYLYMRTRIEGYGLDSGQPHFLKIPKEGKEGTDDQYMDVVTVTPDKTFTEALDEFVILCNEDEYEAIQDY